MTTPLKPLIVFVIAFGLMLSGCFVEDPGPRQETERRYTIVDFERLEMGSGFHIDVKQGNFYAVVATGDRRNVEDLIVRKEGTTLVIEYRNYRERRYDTFIDITMPYLDAVTFSGASESRVHGFTADEAFDVYLSGGSVCQLDVDAPSMNIVLSGASYLNIRGAGSLMDADVSGASALKAFNFPVNTAEMTVSGASDCQVTATDVLDVTATGASHVVYRGTPVVSSSVTGSSSVHQD